MKEANCPLVFWDHCVERRARTYDLASRKLFQSHCTKACTALTGEEGDISNSCQHKFYDWCCCRDHKNGFPNPRELPGRVLGPAKNEGNEMAQWTLKANGNVVAKQTVRPLAVAELHGKEQKKRRLCF